MLPIYSAFNNSDNYVWHLCFIEHDLLETNTDYVPLNIDQTQVSYKLNYSSRPAFRDILQPNCTHMYDLLKGTVFILHDE